MKEKEIKRKKRKKNKRLNIERTETTRCFSFRMVKETRENEFEWVKWKSKVFSLLIHDEFGHHRNKLNDIKTRLLTNAFVQERIAIHSRPFHPSFHSSPLFSILELYQHNNARKIEAIVMMFISILLFFLPPSLYYFFFPFYRIPSYHAHRARI